MAGAAARAGPALGPAPAPAPAPAPPEREWRGRAGSGAGERRAASGASPSGGRSPGFGAAGSQGWRGGSNALYFSSSSDDEFEMFLAKMKTPKSVPKKADASLKDFIDDSDDFFSDLKVKKSTTKSAQKDLQTPKKLMTPGKRNTCCQELQYPDTSSDTEDSVFVESPWHNHQKKGVKDLKESQKCIDLSPPQSRKESVFKGSPDLPVRRKERSCENTENKLPVLAKMKTPKSVPKKADASLKDFIDDSDDFFSDLKVKKSTTKSAQKDLQTPKKRNTCCQELQYPDTSSDTEDSVFVESPWHNHQKKGVKDLKESQKCINLSPPQSWKESVFKGSPDLPVRRKERSCENTENKLPGVALGHSTGLESESSDDSFGSLMERIKKRSLPQKPVLSTSKTVYQPSTTENIKPPCKGAQPVEGKGVKAPKPKSISLQETPSMKTTPARIPRSESVHCSQSAKTEKRLRVCSVHDCFLQDLSNPASHYVKYFKKNKEELAQKLYRLFNSTIFEQKLPENMVIIWNKKMRKTAGYCVTGKREGPEGKRYARIELSEKVCDSADRLRDTLIHEVCHAATWLINGVRDGHGRFWRFYANKSAVIHPELPVVTRCHSYEINYKFTYECVRCKATIGRHSRSLDTARFVCAFCRGQLVLRQPPGKGGTPARTQLTPFAKYVKENYGLAKREQHGLSHAEVMRKLSADFALKTKLEDSF